MKKKWSFLCIGVAAVLLISLFVWWNETVRVADIIDFDSISKVEIWSNDNCVTLTEHGDMKAFTDILDSMKLKKNLQSGADGFVFSINIYHKNGEENNLTLYEDVVIDGQHYKCDRDYCDEMRKFYNSFR